MKLKINASARLKKRYLLIENSDREGVEKAIIQFIGVLGWARANPLFLESKQGKIILAVERKELNEILAAFAAEGKIRVKKVSGNISGLED